MSDEKDRFGTDEAFRAAVDSHGVDNPTVRMGMYVPTREEVATLPIDDLAVILDLWMWESPTELIPTNEQIAEVRAIIAARADAHLTAAAALIAECDRYLAP
jgi:hypothetical protein